jgi:hypothetical protein
MSTPTPPASAAQAAPFYREPVLLDRSQHRGKRVRPTPGFKAAAGLNACALASSEWGEAAKDYVIAFVPLGAADAADVGPVALLGLRDGENLYVEADGRWDARYVPAFVRRYPLAYARSGDDGQQHVIIDAAFEGFNDSEGELLVQDDGEPAPYLQEMIKFLDAYEADLERTRRLCARIVELGLLKAVQIDITLPDGRSFSAGGAQVIDEAKLKALPDVAAGELLRSGALGLLHAHLISTTNLPRLTDRLARRLPAA